MTDQTGSKSLFRWVHGFTRPFWVANGVELLERAAWYGVFVVLAVYLSRILGFDDVSAGWIAGFLGGGLYLLPLFSGALADKIGFRVSLLLAFGLLTLGYGGTWLLPVLLEQEGLVTYGKEVAFHGLEESGYKWVIVPILILVMIGGSFIKSVITGTVSKETNEANRARGYSIFYAMVNIGSFSGKTLVKPLRDIYGNSGFININLFAAGCTLLAFILVLIFYKSAKSDGKGKSLGEVMQGLLKVCSNFRLGLLILIISGFWMVQHQLYATMPKYVLRMVGEGSAPSWYANVNPLVVILTVGYVTHLFRKRAALFSMTLGMFLMPVSAFCMAAGNLLGSETIMWLHPVAFMMIVGICFQALAESFISPRYLEYFSLQAPKGEEGLYLGFSHLHSFISSILGFGLSGYLLRAYCPDPKIVKFPTAAAKEAAYANAHYIWYYFVGIAMVSAIALIIFGRLTKPVVAHEEGATG